MKAFGDSITYGVGASPGNGWVAQLSAALGYTISNAGVSGAMSLDGASAIIATAPVSTDSFILMYGTNDERVYGTDAAKAGYFRASMQAHAVWLGNATRTIGQSSAISYSGTWTNLSAYGDAIAKRSDQNGASASATIAGDVLYLTTLQQDIATGAFTVTVDGALKGTYSTAAPGINTVSGTSFGTRLIRISGLGAGPHSIVVTVTSPSGGVNAVYIVAMDGAAPGAKVYVSNVIRQTAAGYAANGGSDANVAAYNAAVAALVAELAADGLLVYLVDNCSAIIPQVDLADGTHPADYGATKIKNEYLNTMLYGMTFSATGAYLGSDGHYYIGDGAAMRQLC